MIQTEIWVKHPEKPGVLTFVEYRDTKEVFGAGGVDHLHHVRVVMQVLPHAWQVVYRGNAVLQQVPVGPNAGEHQEVR